MAIPEAYTKNFETLERAAGNGDLCIAECKDKKTGKMVIAICAVWLDDANLVTLVPLAKMFDGDPFDELEAPGSSSDEAPEGVQDTCAREGCDNPLAYDGAEYCGAACSAQRREPKVSSSDETPKGSGTDA
jgi:hypothetical protein